MDISREKDSDDCIEETSLSGRFARFRGRICHRKLSVSYRGTDNKSGREIIWTVLPVKSLSAENRTHIQERLKFLLRVKHENVVELLDAWIDAESLELVLITESFSGGSMREYLQGLRQPKVVVLKSWGREILHGLRYLHSLDPPLILRELKLDYLFVDSHSGAVKLGEYAIEKLIEYLDVHVLGSPEYMAPEAFEKDYDEKVDIYSFGVCLLEMASSVAPYQQLESSIEIYRKIQNRILPSAFYRMEHQELSQLLLLCFKEASGRPSAGDLLRHAFFQESPSQASFEPVRFSEFELIEEVPEPNSGASRDSLSQDSIEISIIIAMETGSYKHVKFPFCVSLDEPLSVAEEMIRELNLNPVFGISIAKKIEEKVRQASLREDTAAKPRQLSLSQTFRIPSSPLLEPNNRWSIGCVQVDDIEREIESKKQASLLLLW